jgi:hypothetical protein
MAATVSATTAGDNSRDSASAANAELTIRYDATLCIAENLMSDLPRSLQQTSEC